MAKSSLPVTSLILNLRYPDLSGLPSTKRDMDPTAYSSPWLDMSKHSIILGGPASPNSSCSSDMPASTDFATTRSTFFSSSLIMSRWTAVDGSTIRTCLPDCSESNPSSTTRFSGFSLTTITSGTGCVE